MLWTRTRRYLVRHCKPCTAGYSAGPHLARIRIGWSTPSDTLLFEREIDLYRDSPMLAESTDNDGGALKQVKNMQMAVLLRVKNLLTAEQVSCLESVCQNQGVDLAAAR